MADLNRPENQWDNNFPQGNQRPYPPNQNQFNNYQGNMNPYNPYERNNMGYIPPQPQPQQQPKSPKLIYIILIAVIIFFAVIIVLMSTSIRAMFNGGDNQQENNDHNNIISTQETTEETTEIPTEEETTRQTTTTTTTEPIPETVTVIVEVEKEVIKEVIKEVEVPVQNDYTTIYNDTYYGCVETQKDPLNIRSGAGKSYKVLGSIPKGTYIYVQMTSSSSWYYTTYGGVSGYVSADYVRLAMSDAFYGYDYGHPGYIDGDGHNGDWATIATKSDPLNLRSSPSTSASIITAIPKGSSVYVNYEYDSSWCYVTWGNYSGYVATQYLAF